jgi:hypothetical protein
LPAKYTSLQSTYAYSRAADAREHGLPLITAVISSSELVTAPFELVLGKGDAGNEDESIS